MDRDWNANDDWLDREDVAELCPSCAKRMASLGIRRIRASVLFGESALQEAAIPVGIRVAEKWKRLPEGWTGKSVEKFWESLVGDVKHKVTKCIKKMEGKPGIDDPGAFCAALADRIEGTTKWRGKD